MEILEKEKKYLYLVSNIFFNNFSTIFIYQNNTKKLINWFITYWFNPNNKKNNLFLLIDLIPTKTQLF